MASEAGHVPSGHVSSDYVPRGTFRTGSDSSWPVLNPDPLVVALADGLCQSDPSPRRSHFPVEWPCFSDGFDTDHGVFDEENVRKESHDEPE